MQTKRPSQAVHLPLSLQMLHSDRMDQGVLYGPESPQDLKDPKVKRTHHCRRKVRRKSDYKVENDEYGDSIIIDNTMCLKLGLQYLLSFLFLPVFLVLLSLLELQVSPLDQRDLVHPTSRENQVFEIVHINEYVFNRISFSDDNVG